MSGMSKREQVQLLVAQVDHPAVVKLKQQLPPNPAVWQFADVLIDLLENLKPYQFMEFR